MKVVELAMKSDIFLLVRNEYLKYILTNEIHCALVAVAMKYWFGELLVSWQVPIKSKSMTDLAEQGVCVQCLFKVNFLNLKCELNTE
jgi:hypothetical protein